MSARDLILNSLLKPIDTQVDYSQGYDVGFNAQANRITPEQVRQRDLANAIQRNQQRIQTQITGQDNTLDSASKLLGYNLREQSSANLRGMTPEQRLQSYITGSNHDPELAYDMQNMNDGYLRGKYGDAVADYAYNQRKTAMQDFQRASSYVPEEEQTGNLFTGIAGGLTRGVRQVGGIAEQLGIMAFNEGEEQANKLRQAQHDMEEDISSIARWQGSEYQHQDTKAKTFTQLADNLRQQKFQQIAAQTGNTELAKAESDKLAEEYHAGLNVITHELMVNGLGEQAPQILLAVMSGGAGAAIAESAAMGISRTVATKAIQAAMPKIIQLGAMTGVGIEAGLQDGTSAAADAHVGVYQYFDQARKEAQQGDNTKWNNLFGSEEMKALAQQYPNASPEELISLAANNASISAGLTSGLYTGVSAGLAAPTLSGFSSKLGAALKPSSRWALTSTAPIIEGATEFGEEYVNIVSPRESINRALGVNVHENPSLYATDQALQAGAIGALAGSASTVAGIGSAGKAVLNKGAKALNNAVKGKVDKVKEEQVQETRNTLNEELKEFVPEVNGENINSINVMGTSETTNPDGTVVPAIDGVLPNKNMSNSHFGNALREAVQTKADIESEGKVNGATDYADFISKLHESSVETKLKLDEAIKVGNQEEVNSLQQQLDSLNGVRSTLLEAVRQDVNEVAPTYLNTLDEVNKLNQEYMNTSDEAKQNELQTIMESLVVKLASEEKNFEAVTRLFDSKLYQMLSDETYSTELKERADDKIGLEQYVGKKPSTLSGVLYSTDSISNIISETDNVNEANRIVKSWVSDLIKHSKDISKDNARDSLSSIKASLNKIKIALDKKGFQVDYLNKVTDVLGSIDTNKLTGDRAKSLLNKFFTRDSVTNLPSLMDLLILSNSPETRDSALAQLMYFQASQKAKLAGLLNAKRTNLPVEGARYKTPITNIPTIGSKILRQQNGTPVSFDNERSLNKYIESVESESAIFDSLVNDILNNTTSIKPASKTTPVNRQEKVNTQTQPKETKPQSTSSLGSEEEKNSNPAPKKTKSKKDELPPPPPELTEEEIRAVQESVNRSRKTRESIQEESDTNAQPKQENQSESNTEQSKAIPENNPEPRKEEEDNEFINQYEYAYEGRPINVWAGSRENVVLSNLAPFEFDYMNFTFESVEHAYQTLKDGKGLTQENRDWAEEHRDTFSTGKTVERKVKVDTNKNLNLMFDLLRIRAKDDIDFIDKLSSTELREITHKNPKSSHKDIWTKVFPEMLMRLRDEIHSMNDERTREDIITGEVSNAEPVEEPVQEQEEVQEQTTNSSEPSKEESTVISPVNEQDHPNLYRIFNDIAKDDIIIRTSIHDIVGKLNDEEIKYLYDNYRNLMSRGGRTGGLSLENYTDKLNKFPVLINEDAVAIGLWDRDNAVFITKWLSSGTFLNDKGESRTTYVSKTLNKIHNAGVDVVSFIPEDMKNKYTREDKGYISTSTTFESEFDGEKMDKYLVASTQGIFYKIFGKSSMEVTTEDIEQYDKHHNELFLKTVKGTRDSSLAVNITISGREEDFNKDKTLNETLTNYLGKFGFVVNDISKKENQHLPNNLFDLHFLTTAVLHKEFSFQGTTAKDLALKAGTLVAYMTQYNPVTQAALKEITAALNEQQGEVFELLKEKFSRDVNEENATNQNKAITVLGRLIGEDLLHRGKVTHRTAKGIVGIAAKLGKTIKEIINSFVDYLAGRSDKLVEVNKAVATISNNILAQNKDFVTASKNKPATNTDAVRVSLNDALNKDAYAKELVSMIATQGFILTGSVALAEQGTVFRPDENQVHDLDFVSVLPRKETLSRFKELLDQHGYKTNYVLDRKKPIVDEENGITTDSFVLAPNGYSFSNLVYSKEGNQNLISYSIVETKSGNVVSTFSKENGEEVITFIDKDKDATVAKVVDFFSYTNEDAINYLDRNAVSFNLESGETIRLNYWKPIFKAKMRFARVKDLWDFNRFIPNNVSNGEFKYTGSTIEGKNRAKDVFKENVIKAFNSEKEQNKNDRTRNIYGLDEDINLNGVSQQTVDTLYGFGFSLDDNLLDVHTEVKNENYSSEEVISALNAYTANKNETTAKELVRQLNSDITEDKLTELVNEANLESTKLFLDNFIKAFKEISSYFNSGNYRTVTLNEDSSILSKLDSFNGFTNLIELNQENKEVIPTDVLIGITLSTMEQILDFAVNGNANNKILKERFERISENGFNVYNNSLRNVVFTLNRQSGKDRINEAHSNVVGTKDKETGKETRTYRHELPLDTEDISFIGSRRELLAQRMGDSLVSNLNLRFKNGTPSNVEQAITQSLGNELLNMMLAKHLIDTYRVEINTDTVNEETGSVETVKMFYVNGSFNYEREGHFPANTAKAYNLLMKHFKGALSDKQNNPTTINNATKTVYRADQNNNSWLLLSLDLVGNKETALAKEMFKNSFERKGYEISLDGKPIDKFSPKHISDKILDNAPTEMEMAVRGHNAVGYKLDTDMVAMFKTQPEIFKIVAGFHSANSMEHDLELTKESKKSKNSMVERTMTTIQQILNEVNDVSNEQDAVIYIKHETTETQRVQQAMVNSPQANKIMREVLRVHNGSFDEVEKAFAKKGKMFEYDLNEAQSLLRPVQVSFTLPEADENGVRDVKFLVQQVQELKDKITKKKGTKAQQEKYQTDYQNQVGLLLALAQALGVKIEKRNSENIMKDLEKKFEQQWLNDLVEDIWNWQQDNSIELKPDNFQELAKQYDSSTMRAFSVLQAFARYKYSPDKTGSKPTEFNFNVYLEADGIGNGMSNLVRQFTVGFTSTYFQTLKRVGITTLDLIVKVAKEKGLDLTNLSDEAKETLSDNLEGSAAQFDPTGDSKVLDVYEVVSFTITENLQKSFRVLASPLFKQRVEDLNVPLKNLVFTTNTWREALEANREDVFAKAMLDLINTVRVLNQINVLGHLSGKFYKENTVYDMDVSWFVALMDRPVGALIDNGVNSKTLILSINRALAKLGVTPALYGGGLNGISNQVEKDLIKAAQDKLNSLANQLAKNEPLSATDISVLNNWFSSVGLYESATGGIKWEIRSNVNRNTLQFLSNKLPKFKHIISRSVKTGISKRLHEAVITVYGETLQNANSLIATDTASTNIFALELQTRYMEGQRRRNKEKGYTDTDPRRNDALSKAELKVIIKELDTLPIVASAFSGNTVLFQQLMIEGHTIAKDRLIENVNPAYTSANIVNITGINSALNIASIYSLNMVQKIKSYSAGGATNFTNTVVSTESMVQTVVNFVLGKLGMALLDVYDGLDADSKLAKLVGVIANKAYDNVHKNTNLQESFFHRTNKANLGQYITKDKLTPQLKEVLLEKMSSFKDNFASGTVHNISNIQWTKEELQFLDVYFGSLGGLMTEAEVSRLARSFRTATESATTALLTGSETVSLNISDENWTSFQSHVWSQIYEYGDVFDESVNSLEDYPVLVYNRMLDVMARKASTAAAVKAVESKYLAYNVNQYAGANRGVIINPEQLFRQKGTAQRFAEFIKDKDTNFRQTSALLAEFVAQDKLIQEAYEKAFKDKYNSLSLNFVETGSYRIYQQQRTTTLDKILSNKLKVKEKDNTLIGRTRRVILSVAKDVLPADMKVFFNTNEFLDAVAAQGFNTTNLIRENTSGIFIPNVGIYVNPTKEDQSKILTHEIIHAILSQSLHLYYTNRSEWNELAKGNPKFKELSSVIKKLEHNALAFSNLYNSDPNVRKILDIDNLFLANNFNTPNKSAAVVASIRQAFKEGSILDEDKYIAMQEFLAYALTEEKLLTQMYYNQKAKDIPNSLTKEPKKNKGLIEAIKNVLKVLKEVKLNIARIFFGSKFEEKDLTKDNNFLNESMLFDVLAQIKTLADMNTNLQNQDNSTTLYSTDNSTVTDAHDLFLNELHTLSKTLNFTSRVKESSTATTLLAQNRINQLSSNYIQDIRNSGINISMKEHTAFMLMSGVFEITFSGSNSSLRTEAEKWLNQVFNSLRTNNVFTNEQFKAIFGNRNTFRLTDVMALAVTSKEVKNLLENLPKPEKKRLDGLVAKLTDMTVFLQANRDIIDFKDDTTLEKIALASVHADLNQSMKDSWRETVRQTEKERYLARQDFYNKVDNLTEPFPKAFSELVTTVVYDWAKASNMDGTGKDTDSIIGTALQNLADYTALSKGRTTFLTQALRWILQAREKTQYIYDKRARLAANMETIRESARSTLPTVIRRAFNSEYSEEMDKYISKAVIPTELSRIYTGSNIEEVAEILQSKTKREDMISRLKSDLEVLIRDDFGSATNEVMNWINWQVKGLASMMINRTAKSSGKGKSHHILSNSRTIASLRNLPIKKDTSIEAETLRIAAFEPYIGKLATLHSLNHVSEIDLAQTVKLINQEKKGMEELLNGQSVTKELYSRSHKFNHLGADGYVHSKSDPHEDMRLVYTGSAEQKQLEQLGYYVVQELPNTGMTVMFTNVNPIKRYQTGMFGLAEQSVFGVSVRTKEPLGAITKEYTLRNEDKEAYRQEFTKLSKLAMKNPNYYESLTEDSVLKPVVGHTGFINTYSVELPNSIKNRFIEEVETGIESIGNMQGRILEEGLTAKVNRENIDLLNQKYKESRDKQYFIKIDGKFKAKGNTNADKHFTDRVNEFYTNLPRDTKEYINEVGGLYVYRTEADNILGYHHADLTDIYTGSTPLPTVVQDVAKGLFSVFDMFGVNPVRALRVLQGINTEVVSYGKDVVLNKSVVVGAGNLLSNAVHLINLGVSPKKIVPDAREGLINAQNYVRNFARSLELKYRLANSKLTAEERMLLEPELRFLLESLNRNPVAPLVKAGIMSSISGAAGYEKTFDTSEHFTYLYKAKDKLGLTKVQNKFDNSSVGKVVNNILISRDSAAHEFMNKALDYGDFVSKYVLFKHLTQEKGFSEERAMNVIREEFINYTMNRGALFDYANAMGLTWFASYALGIQKVIYRALRRNTLSTLAIYSAGSVINDYDRLGLLGTVPNQNVFERSWSYTADTSNILESFEAHYLARLLAWLF